MSKKKSNGKKAEEEFAALLDFYQIRYEYEPTTFFFEGVRKRGLQGFTPDFYLPDFDIYVEITLTKQRLITNKHRKMRLMKEHYPDVVVKLFDQKDMLKLSQKFGLNYD